MVVSVNTHQHVVVSVVPVVRVGDELRLVVQSAVASVLRRVSVQHDLIPVDKTRALISVVAVCALVGEGRFLSQTMTMTGSTAGSLKQAALRSKHANITVGTGIFTETEMTFFRVTPNTHRKQKQICAQIL